MEHNNKIDRNCYWDIEFEALALVDHCVCVPITMNQWKTSNLNLNTKKKMETIHPILVKIWKSIQSNLNSKIETWKNMHLNIVPTPEQVIQDVKNMKVFKKHVNLLHTSPFIIRRLCHKINNTVNRSHGKSQLCCDRMEYHHLTNRKDVLYYLSLDEGKLMTDCEEDNTTTTLNLPFVTRDNSFPAITNHYLQNTSTKNDCTTTNGDISINVNNNSAPRINNHFLLNISTFDAASLLELQEVQTFSSSSKSNSPEDKNK